jgi:hypothetical protein
MNRISRQQRLREVQRRQITRRWFFQECGLGLGAIALGSLLTETARAASTNPLSPKLSHFAPKAKRAIYLFMAGAPSHLDCSTTSLNPAKWRQIAAAELSG